MSDKRGCAIEGSNIVIRADITTLFEQASDADLKDLIDSLSCTEQVITYVLQQVFDGWTDRMSHGKRSYGPLDENPIGDSALDAFRRKIVECADSVAQDEIKNLQAEVTRKEKYIQRLHDEARELRLKKDRIY